MNLRAAAARVIFQVVEEGYSLSDCLPAELNRFKDARDRALLQAICFGVCRWYFSLDIIAKKLLDKPLKSTDADIYMLLLVGLYQLIEMRIPGYAAVSATVDATMELNKLWAKGLVNGVLRNYQRREDEFADVSLLSHPDWMIRKLRKAYPDDWEHIFEENNQHPPLTLRVNQLRISREKYLEKLAAAEINAEAISETQSGIILENALDVLELPGFAEGDVSVQDGAAQLAAELLSLEPGQRVLDACAAPGGKTAHILEMQPELAACVAVDHNADRLEFVGENLQRLHLSAQCIAGDVGDVNSWWDGQLFDRILLDAPCSATGVIRRHPDIKLLRRSTDLPALAAEQLRLLNAVWTVLKPGGKLLYATCSIFPEENVDVLKQFFIQQPDAKEEKLTVSWGRPCEIGRQILPGMHRMDGFYYACLTK